MNVDVRMLFGDGERAARNGEVATARACFMEAAQSAVEVQLWKAAMRCYRHALELDLMDREIIERLLRMPARVTSGRGWDEYRKALDQHAAWPHFGCRTARIVIGDHAVIECPQVGPVLELLMTDHDHVEARPDPRFAGMPIGLAMIVVRRALWTNPRDRANDLMTVQVTFDGQQRVRLDEHGDLDPIVGDAR